MKTMMRTRIPIKIGCHIYPEGTEVEVGNAPNPIHRIVTFPDGKYATLVAYLELEEMPAKPSCNPAEIVVLE